MPTYEYVCKKCGRHTEAVQSFHDDPLTVCPYCKGALRKVFGNVGITFKGSGFYKTDSRARPKESAGSSTRSSESSGSESGSGSDTKTADSGSGDKAAPAEKSPAPASSGSANGSKPAASAAKAAPAKP